MNELQRDDAGRMRARLSNGHVAPGAFRAALLAVAPSDRDAWLDCVLGIGELPEDGPELPPGCTPYLPSPVSALLAAIDGAELNASDVFVDVGAGIGRAALAAHLLTGASAITLEIQPQLARVAVELARALHISRISQVVGDAAELAGTLAEGSVFFLYCPFSGVRLQRLMGHLEVVARARTIRVCCVDLPLPHCDWLRPLPAAYGVTLHRSAAP